MDHIVYGFWEGVTISVVAFISGAMTGYGIRQRQQWKRERQLLEGMRALDPTLYALASGKVPKSLLSQVKKD